MNSIDRASTKKFAEFQNFIKFEFTITTTAPLLIKSGDEGLSPGNKDSVFMRDAAGQIFIPGSTLKGFFRGNLERMLPYLDTDLYSPREGIYDFGTQSFGSNFLFHEAHPRDPQDLRFESRTQIAIDRKTMGPKRGALLNLECLSAGAVFSGQITIRNGDVMHLGLLHSIMNFANDGYLALGFNKSRGYGTLKFVPVQLTIESFSEDSWGWTWDESNQKLVLSNFSYDLSIDLDGDRPIFKDELLSSKILLPPKTSLKLFSKCRKLVVNKNKLSKK